MLSSREFWKTLTVSASAVAFCCDTVASEHFSLASRSMASVVLGVPDSISFFWATAQMRVGALAFSEALAPLLFGGIAKE